MRLQSFSLSFIFISLFAAVSCHSSKPITGDNKEYHDDSLIEMKTVERKEKMPFDTSAPVPRKPQQMENRNLPTE